ncbi:MAG: ribosome silencing factor [Cyclobacteriaceae bacterium]|nr:ribosome silencing factor [Cyclobacteriaceae bacterium]
MAKRRKADASERLSQLVVKGMQEKKATNIVVMDLRKVKNAVADFFVIGTGNSDKQLDAIADSVSDEVYKGTQETPWHTEGKNNKEWMLLDYSSVVAHIFRKDQRNFYALERLWGDAEITEIED